MDEVKIGGEKLNGIGQKLNNLISDAQKFGKFYTQYSNKSICLLLRGFKCENSTTTSNIWCRNVVECAIGCVIIKKNNIDLRKKILVSNVEHFCNHVLEMSVRSPQKLMLHWWYLVCYIANSKKNKALHLGVEPRISWLEVKRVAITPAELLNILRVFPSCFLYIFL